MESKSIWWPDKKSGITSLLKRKCSKRLLIEELHQKLLKDKHRIVTICDYSNLSVGGVGKTTTAKWYAHHYEGHYEKILWINCSEENLLQSFQNLALYLKLENSGKLQHLIAKCHRGLKELKCLWIFDNADGFPQNEMMEKILPKNQDNFYCLITSRRRNRTGLKGMTTLELTIFNDHESLEFLKENIDKSVKYFDYQLKKMIQFSGNLPLALQLIVSAVNSEKINLQEYAKRISNVKDESSVNKQDKYELILFRIVNISLELLSKEENGELASNILQVLSFIRTGDTSMEFVKSILQDEDEKLQISFEVLKRYSFIDNYDSENKTITMQRVLQSIIRNNGERKSHEEIQRKILGCKGFLNCKLVPFTFANDELQEEFHSIKQYLLEPEHLLKLHKERRLEESVQLSRYLHREFKTKTSLFNYALCLQKSGDLLGFMKIFEKLYEDKTIKDEENPPSYLLPGILPLEIEVTKNVVGGHLLAAHWRMGNRKRVQELLDKNLPLTIPSSAVFFHVLNCNLIKSNYSVFCTSQYARLQLKFNEETKKIKINECSMDSNIRLPRDVQELSLEYVKFKDKNEERKWNIDLTDWVPRTVTRLTIESTKCILSLEKLSSIQHLRLFQCSVLLDSNCQLSAKELALLEIDFLRNGEELKTAMVNEFVDVRKTNHLELICSKSNMSIDMNDESVFIKTLHLKSIHILDWKEAKWTVDHFFLYFTPIDEQMKMKVKKLKVVSSSVDVSCLPKSIQKVTLKWMTQVHCNGKVELPYLNQLKLQEMPTTCLNHFSSVRLTRIHFDRVEEINVQLLPESVTEIKISYSDCYKDCYITKINGEMRELEKLILKHSSLIEMEEVLARFKPKELILLSSIKPKDLISLTKRAIQKIAVGKLSWEADEFDQSHLQIVNQKSEFYLLESGSGVAMDEETFKLLMKLK